MRVPASYAQSCFGTGPVRASDAQRSSVPIIYFAPTTRTSDGTLSRFYVEARIIPRLKVAAP